MPHGHSFVMLGIFLNNIGLVICDLFFWQVGKHGIIIEFTDPDYNTRRSATYLPEVAAHEGVLHIVSCFQSALFI